MFRAAERNEMEGAGNKSDLICLSNKSPGSLLNPGGGILWDGISFPLQFSHGAQLSGMISQPQTEDFLSFSTRDPFNWKCWRFHPEL